MKKVLLATLLVLGTYQARAEQNAAPADQQQQQQGLQPVANAQPTPVVAAQPAAVTPAEVTPEPETKDIPIIRDAAKPVTLKIVRYYPPTWGNNVSAVGEANNLVRLAFNLTKSEVSIYSLTGEQLNKYKADPNALVAVNRVFSRASAQCPVAVSIDRTSMVITAIKPTSGNRLCDELN